MNTRMPTKFTSALIEEATVAPFFRALWSMRRGRMPTIPSRQQQRAA